MNKQENKPWTTLIELRKNRGMTQEAVANILGVSRLSYQRWESGEFEPSLDSVVRLADLFGVSIDYLLDHKSQVCELTPEEFANLQMSVKVVGTIVKNHEACSFNENDPLNKGKK